MVWPSFFRRPLQKCVSHKRICAGILLFLSVNVAEQVRMDVQADVGHVVEMFAGNNPAVVQSPVAADKWLSHLQGQTPSNSLVCCRQLLRWDYFRLARRSEIIVKRGPASQFDRSFCLPDDPFDYWWISAYGWPNSVRDNCE